MAVMTSSQEHNETGMRRLSLSTMILIGLAAGVACGLFFGEGCAWLGLVGEGFVNLLQMTILPYVTVSLIANIGRLEPAQAKRLALTAGLVLLVLWAIAVAVILVIPLFFPEHASGSFFSAAMIAEPEAVDFLSLYIPANPFHSLANNIVPAVVLFSIFLGVALIGAKNKEPLLDLLDTVCDALTRVNSLIIRLTPLGMFAIAASSAGTLTFEELERLHGYLIVYTIVAVILVFWVLPMLIAACTPFTYRQVVRASRDAIMTAFATGKLFVVLPLLVEAARGLFKEIDDFSEEVDEQISVAVPLGYPFPTIGKLMALVFVPFAAWFAGRSFGFSDSLALSGSGLLSLFGSPVAALPYLLDLFRLPADLFNLFVVAGVWTARIGDTVGVMHLMAFTLLTGTAMTGVVKVRYRKVVLLLAGSAAMLLVSGGALRAYLGFLEGKLERVDVVAGMEMIGPEVESTVSDHAEPNPIPMAQGRTHLERIRERGVIRVGFNSGELPFAYFNGNGHLVGFDIEMAHRFARELGVTIEFVPFEFESLEQQLNEDHFDVAMSGIVAAYQHLGSIHYARANLDLTAAVVVRDHTREDYASVQSIRELGSVKWGVVGQPHLGARFQTRLPNIEVVSLSAHADFFDGRHEELGALVTSAEAGSAWTLRYPEFHVVIPEGVRAQGPLVYPLHGDASDLREAIDHWAYLASRNGTIDELFGHWILGEDQVRQGPRWSVIHDVLHWTE